MNMKYPKIFLASLFISILFLSQQLQSETQNKVYYIPVSGEISFGLAEFVNRGIAEAQEAGAELIVLGIDTFGGRVDASLEMVQNIQAVKDLPIYAYVEGKSWSAGALVAFASERIIMEKGSSIGSASPVTGEGKDLGEKYVSALRAKFQAVAEANGYPENVAAAMVDKTIEVKQVEVGQEIKYLTQSQIIQLEEEGRDFTIKDTVSQEGKLLNLTYSQAKKYNIASGVVDNLDDLLRFYGFEGDNLVRVEKNWAEHLAIFFTNAMMTSLLLTIGFIFIYMELAEPGLGFPALISLICFSLFFFGRYVTNLAEWIDIILFVLGFLLVFVEIFVIPGFGFSGILGGILILVSVYLALSPYKVPQTPWDFHTFQMTLLILLGSLTASIVGGFALLNSLHKIPLLNRIVLNKTIKSEQQSKSFISKAKDQLNLGDKGETVTDLRPVGRVAFGEGIYDAISQHGFIKKQEKVVVVEIRDNQILVKKEV